MKKILLILLLAVLLIGGGISFLFYKSFDEENFKEQIILSTKELTGCDMVIAGGLKVELFPSPIVHLTDVVIKNNMGITSVELMKIPSVEAHVQFASLFRNPLIVDNIVLHEPQIFLRRNDKGENNWNLTFLRSNKTAISKDDLLGQSFLDVPPQFQNIDLKNGTISYKNDLTGGEFKLEEINGKMTSSSITGPFDFNGTLKNGNVPLTAALSIHKLNETGQTNFNLSVSYPNSKAILSIQDGKFEKLGGVGQTFLGSFTYNIPKLSSFLLEKNGYKDLPEPLNKIVFGNGKFNITDKTFTLNELTVHYGNNENADILENAAVADINFIYPTRPGDKTKISTQLHFSLLNMDTFLPYIPKQKSWEDALSKVTALLPEEFDIVMDIKQLVVSKQTIKDFNLSALIHDKQINVRELTAQLSEDTAFKTKGAIDIEKEPNVKLDYTLKTKAIQDILNLFAVKDPIIQTNKITSMDVSGQLQLRPQDLTLSNIDLTINNATVKGGAVFALTEPKLSGYVNLNVTKLNVDDFIPYEAPKEDRSFTEWLQDFKKDLEKSPLLADAGLALTLSGQDITFRNLPIEQFTYEGKIEENTWKTDSLRVSQVAMSNFDYKGTIQKLPDDTLAFKDVQINLEMPKSLLLLNRLKIKSPLVNNSNKVNLKTKLSGSFEKMNIASDISFTQGRIYLQGSVERVLMANPTYALLVKISHPNFHQFMHLFGVTFDQFPSLNGNFAFEGNVKSIPNQLDFEKTEVSIGSQKLQGDLNIVKTESGISAEGTITTPYLYFDKFFTTNSFFKGKNSRTGKAEFSNTLFRFKGLEDLSLDIELSAEKASFGKLELGLLSSNILMSEKTLMLNNTKATINGAPAQLSATLNYSTATPFLKGSLKLDKVPLRADLITLGMFRIKSGLLSSMVDFDTRGNSFNDMMRELSGTGRFAIQNGVISSLNLPAFERRVRSSFSRSDAPAESLTAQLNREITMGETPFDSLEGSFAITNGVFRTSDTVLRTPESNAMIQTNFDIPEWTVNSSVAINLKSFTGYPPISIMVKGTVNNPQTNVDLNSFLKQMEKASADVKDRLLKQEQIDQINKEKKEAKERTDSLSKMVEKARSQISTTEKTVQLAQSPAAKAELVRVKDAFIILQELANKQAPSTADTEKASIQAGVIEEATNRILNDATQQAIEVIRQNIQSIVQSAQQTMHSINRVNQRLAGVAQIQEAHQTAFSAMTFIQQTATKANQSTSLEELNGMTEQVQEAAKEVETQYGNIAKFDIDAPMDAQQTEEPRKQVQGLIRRDS